MPDDRGLFTTNASVESTIDGTKSPFVTLFAAGTWGGGTVKLQAAFYSNVETLTWVDVPLASLTADGCLSVAVNAHALRVNCSGGTAHSITWALIG